MSALSHDPRMARADDPAHQEEAFPGPWVSLWRGNMPGVGPHRTMKEIATEIAADYGFTLNDMKGPSRQHQFSHPRQHIMHALVAERRFSTPQIGRFLGGRDHTTIIHGVRAHQKRVDAQNPEVLAA